MRTSLLLVMLIAICGCGDDGHASTNTDGGMLNGNVCGAYEPLASFTDKIADTYDYYQLDPAYGGFTDGSNFCGPTSVSDTLMWLGDHGFDKLAAHTSDRKKDQHDLIATLGSIDYFKTSAVSSGTLANDMLVGLKKYVTEKGYSYRRLHYMGIGSVMPFAPELAVDAEFNLQSEAINIGWLKRAIEANSSVWLAVGLSHYDEGTKTYESELGHWLAVVGHGVQKDGTPNPNILITRDPYTSNAEVQYLELRSTQGRKLHYTGMGLDYTASADGCYELLGAGQFAFSYPNVVLVGAVALELPSERCP